MARFYGEQLLALRTNSKQGVYPLSAVRDFLSIHAQVSFILVAVPLSEEV